MRVRRIKYFIKKIGINEERYEIRQLHSLVQLKKSLASEDLDIALVAPEYYTLLRAINRRRSAIGKKGILILVKERTRDRDNSALSSSALRKKELEQLRTRTNKHSEPSETRRDQPVRRVAKTEDKSPAMSDCNARELPPANRQIRRNRPQKNH